MTDEQFLSIVDATPLVSIDLIIRNDNGEVLLGRRLNRPARDCWFVPGGRIRKNERVAEALNRISQRELGTVVIGARLLGVFDHFYEDNFLGAPAINTHYVSLGFEANLPPGVLPVADDQHGELRWWRGEDLLQDPEVHPNTKGFFR